MKTLILFFLIGITFVFAQPTSTVPFSTKLYHEIAQKNANKNLIISPASIKSALGLAYMGAEGETANELYNVLQLSGSNKEEVAQHFGDYLTKVKSSGAELKTANRIYLADRYDLAPKYNELTSKYFQSEAEKVNFAEGGVESKINAWVEEQTNHKIKEAVPAGAVDATTSAVLVNAIYFKANWKYIFPEERTAEKDFHATKERNVPVKMMQQKNKLRYADLPDLDAVAFELPYDKTDLVMLVVLPNKVDGLAALQEKLKDVDLKDLSLSTWQVNLQFPKFKIEFGTSLTGVLSNLGLQHMFGGADFSAMVDNKEALQVSEVSHKAFIEVDEKGTEAAAVTEVFMTRSFPGPRELGVDVIVDHPFYFAIRDADTVYFAGHVADF